MMPNLPLRRFESVASRVSHITLQTVRVWGSLELDTLNVLLMAPRVYDITRSIEPLYLPCTITESHVLGMQLNIMTRPHLFKAV